ncbi:MAG TPA: helix-turn-helix domain-containing protein [Steroidobacteraceae bacterium]|nr:helix-turn-helix domain-containing protein [Steroidobacteraceae bacterium]
MRDGRAPHRFPDAARGASAIPAFFLYGEPLQAPDERLIHIETIAARSELHNWTIRPHRHLDLHQLLLIRRGHVHARLDATSLSLEAPALVAVPSGAVHSFSFRPATSGLVLSFATGLASQLAGAGSAIAEFFERPTARSLERRSLASTDLATLGEMLLREFTRSAPGRHAALRGLLGALLANVLRLVHPTGACTIPGSGKASRELVARFRRLIEAHYRSHSSLGTYAAELSVSEAKLRRVCLEIAGRSPIELVHLRLLVEAERLLRYTSMPVTQVGYHLGFDDPAYFTRFFTRRMNVSPRAFRAVETGVSRVSHRLGREA